jgi:hypothetical protein
MALNQSFNQDALGNIGNAAAVSTSSPSYTTGTYNALSLTLAGALRVDGSAVTQPISASSLPLPTGASTSALQTAGNTILTTISGQLPPSLGPAVMANSLPVTIASNQTAIPVSGTVASSNAYAQGATTSGELGFLMQGAATSGSPTYTTATTNPLSLTLAGALRVDGSATTQPISAVALPLPTGAATSALQTTGNTTLSTISGQLPATLGPDAPSGSLSIVPATGAVFTTEASTSSTGTIVSVTASVTSTVLLAANANSKGFIIYNNSANFLYIAFAATSSTTAFSVKLQSYASYNSDVTPLYTGTISGIWSATGGAALVTAFT